MTMPTRLLIACVAALATWLGLGAPGFTAVESSPAPVAVYAYDSQQHIAPTAATTSERGPPAALNHAVPNDAVDRWSRGAVARLAPGTTPPIITYDHPVLLVESAGAVTTDLKATPDSSGLLSSFQRSDVAAKTGAEVIGPARNTDLVLESFRGLGKGGQKTVRTVGSVDEMRATFDAWTVGAERLAPRGPCVPDVYRLPDGGVIQWRTGSSARSGGGPTVDIFPVGGAPRKVHLADGVPW